MSEIIEIIQRDLDASGNEQILLLHKINKDLINFKEISKKEVRFLVDTYLRLQDQRIRHNNQTRALNEDGVPSYFHEWLGGNFLKLEKNIKNILHIWCKESDLGQRLLNVSGIGPVITSGLLAHIDFTIAISAACLWRYAGLDPTKKWEKGQKRPWNPSLKVLCWYAGQSFVKVQNKPQDYYGKIYKQRRAYEEAKNDRGDYEEIALEKAKKVGKTTEAYKYYSEGKLPPAHLLARCCRYTVKIFLSHVHEAGYKLEHDGKEPPYPFEKFEIHTHKLEVPF